MQRYTVCFFLRLLYMFRVVPPPIIRSTNNCIYSIWYLSHRYCYLPLSWKRWNWVECAVGGVCLEQFPDKLCNVESCWIYIRILIDSLWHILTANASKITVVVWPKISLSSVRNDLTSSVQETSHLTFFGPHEIFQVALRFNCDNETVKL
jgi:hypothetical protein